MLKLEAITKIYKTGKTTVSALKGVDFSVVPGDFIVIRGPSGSGKSTLLNILGLLDEPTSGTVTLNNQVISYDDYDKLATTRSRTMSFIFQAFNLNPVLTLEENVMVPLMIRRDLSKKEKMDRVAEWVEKTGLSDHRYHRPDELSGGQRQRVAIARAMVSKPDLVIADEPTANLDSETTRKILLLMKQLNEEKGTAFVFATHDPVLDEFSKSAWVIRDGKMSVKAG